MIENVPDVGSLRDSPLDLPVLGGAVVFAGAVWDVRRETVDLGPAGPVVRDLIDHPGAVGVLALDDRDRVLLVRQYRHPVRAMLWELPAGLRDVAGEAFEVTAARELWEETGYRCDHFEPLVDILLSPGGSSERLVLFVAHGVSADDGDRHAATGEELGMEVAWWPVRQVVAAVLTGHLRSASLAIGVLALQAQRGFDG